MKKLLLTIALVAAAAAMSYGQGTIQFNNSGAARFQLQRNDGVRSNIPPAIQLNVGFFFGLDSAAAVSDIPRMALGPITTPAGIISGIGGKAYQLPNTTTGQSNVWGRVRGWSTQFGSDWRAAMAANQAGTPGAYFGETDIRNLAPLGLPTGPGVVIWQGATGTNPNRFNPLTVFEAIPEPSVIGLAIIGLGSLVFFRRRR